MLLEIRGHNLARSRLARGDRACRNAHAGPQVGREPVGRVPGDSDEAFWRARFDVRRSDDVDLAGEAVQGRRGERFAYLTWGDVGGDGTFAMFGRAKLMLDETIPLLGPETTDQLLVASVDLTDEKGGAADSTRRPWSCGAADG